MEVQVARVVSVAFVLLFVAGCRVFDISEEQAQQIADMAGKAASGITDVAAGPLGPGAGAGLGAVVGLAVAASVKGVLSLMTKKKTL
jgi:hypothetical protein